MKNKKDEIVVDEPVKAPEPVEVEAKVEAEAPKVEKYRYGKVVAKMLNIRKAPSKDAPVLRIAYADDAVRYKNHSKGWVELEDGSFCMSEFIQ